MRAPVKRIQQMMQSREGLESSSDGETEHVKAGEAYQLLLNTLAPGREVSARPSKRQKTAAGFGGVVKPTNTQLQTKARKQVRTMLLTVLRCCLCLPSPV